MREIARDFCGLRISQKNRVSHFKCLTKFSNYYKIQNHKPFRRVLHIQRESGEMADTLDLGSSALGVRVQVPPLAISAGKFFCGNSSVVERHLAKVDVAGPTPVFRFLKLLLVVVRNETANCNFFCGNSSVVERHLAKVDVAGPTPVFRSPKGGSTEPLFFQ